MRFHELVSEAPLPPDWDSSAFDTSPGKSTFKSRIQYAVDRAQKLGTGSSRRVFTIEYENRPTALKIATNAKGLSQNAAELDILDDGYLGRLPIVIPLIDYDRENPRPVWIQTELAQRTNPKQLQTFMTAPLETVVKTAHARAFGNSGWGRDYGLKKVIKQLQAKHSPEEVERFSEYVDMIQDLLINSDTTIGDLAWYNNWGMYQGRPVILDLGASREVMSKHYGGTTRE